MSQKSAIDKQPIIVAHRAEIFVKFQHRLLTVDIAGKVRHKRLAGHGGVFTAVHESKAYFAALNGAK